METRELFWEIGPTAYVVFYAVAYSVIAFFLWSVLRHILKYRRGASHPLPIDVWAGIGRMIREVLSQRPTFRRDRFAGHGHSQIFYGFVLLFIGTSIITLEYEITEPLFGFTFWQGGFYLVFSLVMDIAGVALIAGLIFMIWRRAGFRLAKLEYRRSYRGEAELRPPARGWRREDWLFVGVLLLITVTGFLQEAVRLSMDQPPWQAWSPVGLGLARVLEGLGMDAEGAAAVRRANWWFHGMLSLAFIAAIPWYKAKHMIAALGSLVIRDPKVLSRLPRVDEKAGHVGVASIEQFSWKDALNFDACIRCGKCHEACPATTVGAPLSPRDLILDLREHNDAAQGRAPEGVNLIGDIIDPETLWACTSCGACSEVCPVGIEHPAIILQMRRHLVEQGEMDPQLQSTLDTVANLGNSFGENPRKRGAWTKDLEFPVKDIREEPADVLWFVGDYASFDPRNQKVNQTVARLLRSAGIDFALLYEGERTAGNDIRRVGEEGLFESLVEHNLDQMNGAKKFSWIITTDPHSYNTIKNEYPEFGEVAPIRHYSAVLAELFETGKLKPIKPLGKRVTYHDPCYLGRLNGEYEASRAVLRAIGCELVEMPRNRDNSFCCGAGGGRIWMPDPPGLERPSENRMHEAAALDDIDYFVTCCPKDLTMFEDARKTSGHEKDFVVTDLAELVAEAIELESIPLKDVPSLTERIVDAVADRIAEVVASRLDQVLAARLGSAGDGAAIPVQPAAPAVATEVEAAPAARPPTPPEPAAEAAWSPGPVTAAELPPYEVPAKEGPRIMVAVKHVAVLGDEYAFTEDGRDVQEEYLDHVLNEWDDAALEEALLTVERAGAGEVVAVTVGPESTEATLRKVLAKGAHRAVRVWNDSLVGADPVTVARALAGVAVQEQPDLIFTGVQSSDHAHGATGTVLARILRLPYAAVVIYVEWDGSSKLVVTRELEGGVRHRFELPSPAVLTIQTGINTPRYATMRMIKQAKDKPLVVVDGSSLAGTPAGYVVRRMYTPPKSRAEMLEGSAEEVAAAIAKIIREKR